MDFIDLFAGLGGFHLALKGLGHNCVFASEINEELQILYEKNFGIKPVGDIKRISVANIPAHDILCAGFPCQPFSKAGNQKGFNCPKWGDLFDEVLKILKHHRPQFFILENVPNIKKHNQGQTWRDIIKALKDPELGYSVEENDKLSPHQFGIPQIRHRVFIVGSRKSLSHFEWPKPTDQNLSLGRVLHRKPIRDHNLPKHYVDALTVWQEFIDFFDKNEHLPSFPIWSMEFGATYPFEDTTPYALLQTSKGEKVLKNCLGAFGCNLSGLSGEYLLNSLPNYAQTKQLKFPIWKQQFIKYNRELFDKKKENIALWLPKIKEFHSSAQKLEWNYKGGEKNIWKHVLQFRASGIRVKRANTAPSLISMSTTQIPIVGNSKAKKRFMTKEEAARLQSMHKLKYLPETTSRSFKALGNAVNVRIAELIATNLIICHTTIKNESRNKSTKNSETKSIQKKMSVLV